MSDTQIPQINLSQVLKNKNQKLARFIPRFMIGWIERLICQRQLNEILRNYSHLSPYGFIDGSLDYIGVGYSSVWTEDIPEGRYVFASNHPLGGIDGLVLANVIHSRFDNIKLVVNDLLMAVVPLRPIFVPVNKTGSQSISYARMINDLYASDSQIVYFPAGLCSRQIGGQITDPEWKKNFMSKTLESRRDVVPIYFDGLNSRFFYRFARFRKCLGIKFNIEMILLPREMFKQKGKTLKVIIGKPIPCQTLVDMKNIAAATALVRKKCYELAGYKNNS